MKFRDLFGYSPKKTEKPQRFIKKGLLKSRLKEQWLNLMDSPKKKMSRGGQNIFKMIKSRCAWGNKQLWGSREKGKNKPGHKVPKEK